MCCAFGVCRSAIPYDEQLEQTIFTLANDMLKDICQVPVTTCSRRISCLAPPPVSQWLL